MIFSEKSETPNLTDYLKAKPDSVVYYGDKKSTASWRLLYFIALKLIATKHPDELMRLERKSILGDKIEIGSEIEIREFSHPLGIMRKPDGKWLFAETDFNAHQILLRLKKLMEICKDPLDTMVIYFSANQSQNVSLRTDKSDSPMIRKSLAEIFRPEVPKAVPTVTSAEQQYVQWLIQKGERPSEAQAAFSMTEKVINRLQISAKRLFSVTSAVELKYILSALRRTPQWHYFSSRQQNQIVHTIDLYREFRESSAKALANAQAASTVQPPATASTSHPSVLPAPALSGSQKISSPEKFSCAGAYPYRYTLLSDSITTDSVVLWIDALGAEWLSLLCWTLQKDNNGQIKSVALAQSCLPTETEYNDQWNKMDTPHDKLDKLDKLAHHGVIDDPSYYACIQEQFSFFSKVVDKVEELFQKYHRVIITGDHGSSRLAARFFHAREGYPAPASSQVCSHGRFCIFNGAKIIASSNQVIAKDSDGNQYLIFKNYDHFKQSGFAAGGDDENAQYGELHGGASPEELLVPVVVFDSIHELPLTATWKKDSIKFSMKKAKPVILFNKPVQNVQASLGSVDGICTPIDTVGKEWMIVFSENKAEATKNFKYDPIIIADGKVVHVPSLEIKPALGGGDFDL